MLTIKPINAEIATLGRKAVAAHIMRDRALTVGPSNYRGQDADYLRRDAMRNDLRPVVAAYNAFLPKFQGAIDRLEAAEAAEIAALAESAAAPVAPVANDDDWLADLLSGKPLPATPWTRALAAKEDAEQALDALIARWGRVSAKVNALTADYDALQTELSQRNAAHRRGYAARGESRWADRF